MNVGMRPRTRSFVLLILLAVLATVSFAQTGSPKTENGIAGKWRTEIQGRDGKLGILVELKQAAGGGWIGNFRSSDDPDRLRELREVEVRGNNITFHTLTAVPQQDVQIRSDFTLEFRPKQDKLRGRVLVDLPGMQSEHHIELTRVVERAGAGGLNFQAGRPLVGAWSARPDKKDKLREIQLELVPEGDAYNGTLTDTSIDETVSLRDLAIKDTSISFNFRFDGAPFMSSFWGRYDPDRDEVRGSMSIGGRSQPLSFERTSPGPDDVADEFSTDRRPLAEKHKHKFALVGSAAYWVPLYIIKDNVRNINDITTPGWGGELAVRYHVIDYLAFQLSYIRGGLGFDTNQQNLDLFAPPDGPQSNGMSRPLTTDSYIAMDGFEFSFVGFIGQSLFPTSRFNPYIIGTIGKTSWELTSSGRGSEPIAIFEKPVTGSDWTFGGGLGTEYAFSHRLGLEFEWLWAYTLTEDKTMWSDVTYQWTNQHVYRLSLGLILWF